MTPSPLNNMSGSSRWRQHFMAITFTLIAGVPLIAFFAFLMSPIILFLWNSLMPDLFGAKSISWLQAMGLFILVRLLLPIR